jgi:hypothetical protein
VEKADRNNKVLANKTKFSIRRLFRGIKEINTAELQGENEH